MEVHTTMRKLSLFIIVGLIFILVACGNQNDKDQSKDSKSGDKASQQTVKIQNKYKMRGESKDGSGGKQVDETVEVNKNPKNAIVLDYGTLDTLKELGVADQVKALPKGEKGEILPDFLKDFKDDKYVNTGTLKEVNFDKIAEAKPEVIFASPRTATQKNLDEFKKAAPNAKVVFMGSDSKNELKSLKANTEKLGKIYDKEDKAKSLNQKLDDKVAEVKTKTEKMKDKKALFLLVNEGELSTFGPGGRFGGLLFDTLGFTPADKDIKDSPHGQNVTNEYIHEKNPAIIFAMDRGQAVGGNATAKKALSNNVIKNVDAVKMNKIYELDPKLWYFSSGSTSTTAVKQIEEIEKSLDK